MDGGEHEGPGPPGSVRRDADGFVMPDLPVKSPAKSEGPRLVEREGKDDGFPVPPPRPMSRDTGASAALEKPNSSAQVDGAAEGEPAVPQAAEGDAEGDAEARQAVKPPSTYTPPEWAGRPGGDPYRLDVLRGGVLLGSVQLTEMDHFRFGRGPTCEIVTDHPTCSRLHAVLQLKATGEAFLVDCASTHGTFLNKRRLKPYAFAPVRVGDMVRLGESSRLYVLEGPPELRGEDDAEVADAEAAARVKLAEQARATRHAERERKTAEIRAAIGGVTWGVPEDAPETEDGLDLEIDWRKMLGQNQLNDKQRDAANKIRLKEAKLERCRGEADRLRKKDRDSADGLSAGQAQALRNLEIKAEKLEEEIGEMEEELEEALRESVMAKKGLSQGKRSALERQRGARRRARGGDGSDGEGSDDDDDNLLDLTKRGKKKARQGPAGSAGSHPEAEVVTVESLAGQKAALEVEKKRLEQALAVEEATLAMDERSGRDGGGSGGGEGPSAAYGSDDLDAFMAEIQQKVDKDKVQRIKDELEQVDAKLSRVGRLLDLADPDGYYRPKEGDLEAHKREAQRKMAEERLRKMQEEAARRQAEIDAKRAKELAERRGRGRRGAEVVEEEEEGTGEAGASSQGEAGARNGVEAGAGGGAAGGLGRGDRVIEREGVGLAGLRAAEGQGGAVAGTTRVPVSGNGDEEGGLIVPAKRAQKVVKEGKGRGTPGSASASGPPNPKSTAPSSAAPSTAAAAAQARVREELQRLLRAKQGVRAETEGTGTGTGESSEEAFAGQTGDGRTRLNDKYGY